MNRKLQLKLSMLFLFIMSLSFAQAQDKTVSGTVTSTEDNSPLPGVSVLIKGTATGTVTDLDGNYRLTVSESSTVLVFSYIGFISQEVEVAGRSAIDLALEPDTELLDEVVVVGYGQNSKRFNLQTVSNIGAEEFASQPVVSPQELLQGRAAGVQVTGTSGVLGARQNINIRGVAAVGAGSSPLFVVDGVPLNDGTYSNGVGATSLNPLQDINPNDIENITVLKDASAVAIYGSRGANGVILITTKKGSNGGKTNINLDYFTGISKFTKYFDMMSADEFREFRSSYLTAQGTPTSVSDFPQGSDYDWPDAVLQTGSINSYSLSSSGGNEKTSFYIGGTYLNQEAFTIGNEVDKLNGRFNISHNATDKLRFGANLALSRLDNDRISSDNSTAAPLTTAYLQVPYVSPFNEDGSYARTGFLQNVIAREQVATFNLLTRRTTGNAYVELDIIDGLTLKTDFGADMIQTEETFRTPDVLSPGGYGYKRIIQDNKWLNTTTLNYIKTVGKHNFMVLLGNSFETSTFSSITVEGTGFVSDQLPNVASAATPSTTSSTGTKWALASQFSRFNYRFKDRYLFEASVRRDGSSRFGSENRYGIFWALSGGWLISEEDFMQDLSFVNTLKLRASYGTSGNDRIGNFASLGLYAAGNDYNGAAGIVSNQPANSSLQWEETAQLDVGFDASLFDSRLNVDFSYYIKTTTGGLTPQQLPFTTGFTSFTSNISELENKGIDLLVSGDIIRKNDFTWNASVNLGYLQNELTRVPDDASTFEDASGQERQFLPGTASQRAVVGGSLNEFFLIRYVGVNPETGDAEWLTKDGETTTSPTADDRVLVGSAIPDFTGGITNTFKYKGLELSVLFNFVSGNFIMRDGRRFTENAGTGSFNKSRNILDYWRQSGDNAYFPNLASPTARIFNQRSTAQLEDGSFLRLRNLTLAYNLPKSILDKTKVLNRARVFVMGQNLLTISATDLEPEVNDGGGAVLNRGEAFFTPPQARTFTFGVSLGF